jgi:predicted short-subunit dehydrogenase-like oxidoreductase (DUF2520 family)
MVKITFIGSGNVATHLARGFKVMGVGIHQVYSHTFENANQLATEVDATAISNINEIDLNEVSLVVIAVKDDIIKSTSELFDSKNVPVVHTSGTVSMDVLSNHSNHGVFYPLQTFSKNHKIDLSLVPFCIEGSSKVVRNSLIDFGAILSKDVRIVDSLARKNIHLAAVFACNFSNHMMTIANDILKEKGQDISILNPLVKETISKALEGNPAGFQTGPAVRKDSAVMDEHLFQLKDKAVAKRIYKEISESIINWKK